MKKKIWIGLTFALAIFCLSPIDTKRDTKLIYWDQRALTWEDFKGPAQGGSPYVALTHSAIILNFGGEENNVDFCVETAFYPKLSWKKKNVTNFVLKHEQGHFDITEIYSRILRKALQETKFKKYETIGSEVQKIFNETYKACDEFQDQYDEETDHSRKEQIQLNWDTKIATMLDSLSAWSTPAFSVDVSYLLE